jgi:hypothetical protein
MHSHLTVMRPRNRIFRVLRSSLEDFRSFPQFHSVGHRSSAIRFVGPNRNMVAGAADYQRDQDYSASTNSAADLPEAAVCGRDPRHGTPDGAAGGLIRLERRYQSPSAGVLTPFFCSVWDR